MAEISIFFNLSDSGSAARNLSEESQQ